MTNFRGFVRRTPVGKSSGWRIWFRKTTSDPSRSLLREKIFHPIGTQVRRTCESTKTKKKQKGAEKQESAKEMVGSAAEQREMGIWPNFRPNSGNLPRTAGKQRENSGNLAQTAGKQREFGPNSGNLARTAGKQREFEGKTKGKQMQHTKSKTLGVSGFFVHFLWDLVRFICLQCLNRDLVLLSFLLLPEQEPTARFSTPLVFRTRLGVCGVYFIGFIFHHRKRLPCQKTKKKQCISSTCVLPTLISTLGSHCSTPKTPGKNMDSGEPPITSLTVCHVCCSAI